MLMQSAAQIHRATNLDHVYWLLESLQDSRGLLAWSPCGLDEGKKVIGYTRMVVSWGQR